MGPTWPGPNRAQRNALEWAQGQNESFRIGLFHWMLSCSSGSRRPAPSIITYKALSLDLALKLLCDLKSVYSNNTLRKALVKLIALVGRDKFAFLVYAQPLVVEALKSVLQTWNFKKDWLSDPSTYPIFVIMGCAVTFCTGASLNALFRYKDVTINPAKRNSKLQTWGDEKVPSRLEQAISWNAYGKEGLGINHEQWLKQKEAARKA